MRFSMRLLFTVTLLCVTYAKDFTWTNCLLLVLALTACAGPADSPLKLSKVEVTPNPIVIPGNVNLNLDGAIISPIQSSSLSLSLTRNVFGLVPIHVPCISHVGSCNYPDICVLLNDMVSQNWAGIMGSVGKEIQTMLTNSNIDGSACPQPAQNLHIEGQSIHIPEVPAILSFFAAGDYKARINVTENTTGRSILCLDAELTVKEACTGFFCLFG